MLENYIKYLKIVDSKLQKFFEIQKPYIFCKKGCANCCKNAQFPYSRIEMLYLLEGAVKLSEEIQKELSQYSQAITEGLNKAYKELAESGVKTLENTHPYHDRTGKYAKGFAATQRKGATSVAGAESYTVHNKKHYQVTHLLEFGHLTRKGTRTGIYKHWQTALDNIDREAEKVVEKVVNNAGSK